MLYHLVSQSQFESLPATEPYVAASLAVEGFIHLSATPEQVAWVANAFYGNVEDLAALVIDEALAASPIKFDSTPDGVFPHLYGPLNRQAIVAVRRLSKEATGRYVFRAEPF